MDKKVYAIDLLSLYLGVEHYYSYDELGRSIETKEIELYCQKKCLSSTNTCRRTIVNLSTSDEIDINQDGIVFKSDSKEREIADVENIKQFKECIEKLIDFTSESFSNDPDIKGNIEYFKILLDHMNECEEKGHPAYLELDSVFDLIDAAGNIYTLAYGNPLTNETKERCLFKFLNNKKKGD